MDAHEPMDPQEQRERLAAAEALTVEDEKLLVDYAHDCIAHSTRERREIRQVMSHCYNVFKEREPASYAEKEEWQSRIVVPKPYATVMYGVAAVKKAFSPDFLTVKNEKNPKSQEFWQRVLGHHLADKQRGDFATKFAEATTMALAVGDSMEMIPRWVPGKGLEFVLIEPWKIQRDPDAPNRDPQGGMYWIHQEWLDYWVLKKGEADGKYFDVARAKNLSGGGHNDDPFMSQEAVKARKNQVVHRSDFRESILTSEIYGQVIDQSGEIILPRAAYTIAGGRVIEKPRVPNYRFLRWPGVDYSPLPDLLEHGGRGLLEGVVSVWEAWNNLMNLHQDYLQWVVNPPREILQKGLVNIDDTAIHPGKEILTKETPNGQPVVRHVTSRTRTNDALASSQSFDQHFQRGSMVTDGVQGLPGYRKEVTFRESAMNLDQALGVFGLMGENMEGGAGWAIRASVDVIESNIGYTDLLEIFTEEELAGYGVEPSEEAEQGVVGISPFDGSFHVSGIQALMRDAETLKNIREIVIPLSESGRYAPYIKPLEVLRSIEKRTNLEDEKVFASDEEARIIDIQERLARAKEEAAMEQLQDLQEALGIAELAEKLGDIEDRSIEKTVAFIQALAADGQAPPIPVQPQQIER